MKKKFLVSGVIIVVLGLSAYFLFGRGGRDAYELRLDSVSQGDVSMTVTATGTITAVTQVEVGTQVSGIIAKLYADFNSIVKEGQVIAQIDPTFLQQAVKDAEANLERTNAQHAEAKRNAERTQALFDKGMESQATRDAAQTQFESANAALKQSQASLDRAKINLAYTTIYAPINGVVIDRKVNVGQTVAASFSSPTLYTIANDLGKMQVLATVDESDIGKITTGQEASFSVDAYANTPFRGIVSQIRLAPVSIQNVVNYTVVVDVDNRELKLMPGMTASVRIMVGNRQGVLRVPNLALRFQPPADLVDSSKVTEVKPEGGRGDGERRGEGRERRRPMGEWGGADRREGGEGRMTKGEDRKDPGATQRVPVRRQGGTKFGIQNVFPEYEKNSSSPEEHRDRGRIWIKGSGGKLEPVAVVTGLSDGKYTELVNSSLQAGTQVVLGASSRADRSPGGTTNPLSPQGQSQQRGMGPGGPR